MITGWQPALGAPPLTSLLANHISTTRFSDLPPDAVLAAKRSIFDTLGVMLAGSGTDSSAARFVPVLAEWGGKPEATVIGHELRLPAPHAAFANGSMAHQFDFDDTHDAAVVHPSSATLPAALAVAESIPGCRGSELVRAMVLGNDLVCRLGLSLVGEYDSYDFLRGPAVGIWGATAGAATLLELVPQQVEWALGHTLHQTSVTLECLRSGSDVRGFRDGFTARAGVTAAWMAKAGVRGDNSALEGRYGLLQVFFRGEYRPEVIRAELGDRFEGAQVSLKPWPSSREGHATLRSVLELRDQHCLTGDEVQSICLHVSKTELKYCEPAGLRRRPTTRNDALQSLPFAVAVALHHGAVPLNAYSAAKLDDPAVRAIVDRVTWVDDPKRSGDWTQEGVRVVMVLANGRSVECTSVPGLGHPRDPLPDILLKAKFRDCAAMSPQSFSPAQIDHLHEVVSNLEHLPVQALSDAICGHASSGEAS